MGDKAVSKDYDEAVLRSFTHGVLEDLQALEAMIEGRVIESDVRRIGAEQEMFIVDRAMRPMPVAMELIAAAGDERLTTEIGKFNLEANASPVRFAGDCLRTMEAELNDIISNTKKAAAALEADIVLTGILPTIQRSDLTLWNLTPHARYHELNRVVSQLHGENRFIHIKGVDELQLLVQDITIEFCNTSSQIHFQVGAEEICSVYNWAQALAGPVLACAVNSPLLLHSRLWNETRIALFQHATDTRSPAHAARRQPPRVHFGNAYAPDRIIDMLREDAVRFRFLLASEVEEEAMKVLHSGRVPKLGAWRLHNGTIWRWNRICYGITDERPGLRIETRFLPAGPSVVDQMANAALFLGLLCAMPAEFGDVREKLPFDTAKQNFYAAARYGLRSQIGWLERKIISAGDLLKDLVPLAQKGLDDAGIDRGDSVRLLGVIEERVATRRTGSKWMIESVDNMDPRAKPNVRMRTLTAAMKSNQEAGAPVHKWPLAEIPTGCEWIDNYKVVEQFMSSDLYTVRPEDALDLAVSLMTWRKIRHVPVESDNGELVGLLSYRDFLRLLAQHSKEDLRALIVRDVMKKDLVTIEPRTPALEALQLMRDLKIGCLPVISDDKLVGILTAHDFLTVSSKLFEERLMAVAGAGPKGGELQ